MDPNQSQTQLYYLTFPSISCAVSLDADLRRSREAAYKPDAPWSYTSIEFSFPLMLQHHDCYVLTHVIEMSGRCTRFNLVYLVDSWHLILFSKLNITGPNNQQCLQKQLFSDRLWTDRSLYWPLRGHQHKKTLFWVNGVVKHTVWHKLQTGVVNFDGCGCVKGKGHLIEDAVKMHYGIMIMTL